MLDSRSWFSMMFITIFSPDGKVHAKLTQRWRPYHRHPWPLPSCTLCLLAKYLMSLAELDTHFSLKHLQHMCPDKFHPVSASMGPPKLSKIRNHGIPFWEIRNGSQPAWLEWSLHFCVGSQGLRLQAHRCGLYHEICWSYHPIYVLV